MKVLETALADVLIIEPDVFGDTRGHFMETYQKERYVSLGIESEFVQDNLSFSTSGTLRGLHYQLPNAQAKLVQVLQGEVFDVAVDIRRGSPSFGRWVGVNLSEQNRRQVYIPVGFAHGFCVVSDTAVFSYKCSAFYDPDSEGGILWSDPGLGIGWPLKNVVLSDKDRHYACLKDTPTERLPLWEVKSYELLQRKEVHNPGRPGSFYASTPLTELAVDLPSDL